MGKRIVITGAGRGIGRAAALKCGRRGWSVAIGYAADADAAADTVAAVEAGGALAIAVQGDVAVEADVLALFDAAEGAFGGVDGVVVNAGIVAPPSAVADMDAARLKRMFDVNILGAFLTAREAARRVSDGGAVVVVSSIAARLGSPNEYVDYAASKGAVDVLTLGLAKELAPRGVRVNAVRPGLIDTEIHASGGRPDRAFRLAGAVPLGRPGTADEVANAIVWLLSDEASYVTGTLLDVGGGR